MDHDSPWHAPHALRREYTMVLHLHTFEPSRLLGPVYLYPDGRGGTVNAARDEIDETAMPAQPKGIRTTPTARGLQVSRNLARILILRVICLEIVVSCRKQVGLETLSFRTQSHDDRVHFAVSIWAIAEPETSSKVVSAARTDI